MAIRFSRGFEEDPDYHPQWRALQAREYAREYEEVKAQNPDATFLIPPDEDDELVLDYFSYLVLGDCNDDAVKYAHSCNESNGIRGMGTMIQSMFVGGLTPEEIADEIQTSEGNVHVYLKLFFDVERYLKKDALMLSIISPYAKTEGTDRAKQNALWLGISYAFGWKLAKNILQRRIKVDPSILETFVDSMKSCINLQAAEYIMAIRSGSLARPSDFERYISQTNATALSAAGASEEMAQNAQNFRQALMGLIQSTAKDLPDEHPVQRMLKDKEQAIETTSVKQKVEEKKFVKLPIKRL
jgi:hypothetical protein